MQQGYPPQGAPNSGYGPPPGQPQQYPPQQQFQQPPNSFGGQPPQPGFGQPQQSYGSNPQQGYGNPPAQQGYGPPAQQFQQPQQAYGAPQQSYGAPQQPYGAPQQSYGNNVGGFQPQASFNQPQASFAQQPGGFNQANQQQSPTYLGAAILPAESPFNQYPVPVPPTLPNYNPAQDVEALHKAMKGFGTDEKVLIRILSSKTTDQMPVLEAAYSARFGKSLESVVKKEVSGRLEDILVALIQGPLVYDCELVHKACRGAGTDEDVLTEVLVGRTPSDLQMLRAAYQKAYNASLDQVVAGELSLKTRDAFNIVLQGRCADNGMVDPGMIQNDVHQLSTNMRVGRTDEMLVCSIIFARSSTYLQALNNAYFQSTKEKLTKAIRRHFSGHLQDALLHAASGGKRDGNGVWRDAKLINKAMAGAGTKDARLVMRIVRGHWNAQRWRAIVQSYQTKYKSTLVSRVKSETSGKYEDALVALIG